jgi:hypothetical protein
MKINKYYKLLLLLLENDKYESLVGLLESKRMYTGNNSELYYISGAAIRGNIRQPDRYKIARKFYLNAKHFGQLHNGYIDMDYKCVRLIKLINRELIFQGRSDLQLKL